VTETSTHHITIYTDGAARGNPGPGGYGIVLMSGKHRKELSAGYRRTTNNRMELLAVIVALEQLKHERFIEQRNSAQEALFGDIVRYHQEFGTGLSTEDLWSLHDSMKKVVDREVVESSEQPLHEHVEYHFIRFLRSKALEQAWQRLEEYVARFGIPFPISSSMKDPKDPLRNERVKEESKRLAKGDFLNMRARELSELILGNVPAWVYSYPAKDSYLWQLTVLRGIAAGLGADLLMKYLSLWEANSADILKKIEQEFKEKIGSLRRRGEAATDLAEVYSVSMELQRISREEIPHRIWEYVSQRLTGS